MKPSTLMMILFGGILFWSDQQVAFANAFTAIWDTGRELTKSIFSHPITTITDMGKGLTFGYDVRSLSSNLRSLKAEKVLPAEDAELRLKREQSDRDEIIETLKKKKDRKRKLALKSTPEVTDFVIYWHGIARSGVWFYRMYSARNAKKKLTKAEEARKQEYYCGNNEEDKLKEYCAKAISDNPTFFGEKGWLYDPTKSPKCELKHIILHKYDYMSERGVLTCPIVIKREGEDEEHSFVYISSVDDPPKNRLAFYVFTEADEDVEEYARKIAKKKQDSAPKSTKDKKSKSGIGLRSILPAVSLLRAASKSEVGLTKSLLLPASTSAIRAIKNMDGEGKGIKSYLPFAGSKKKTSALPPGKPLKVVSLIVNKTSA